LSRE
jgi:hypothetical protein